MTEIEAMAAKASFRETLAEVGIADTSQFEEDFEDLIAGARVEIESFKKTIDENNVIWVLEFFSF